MRSVLRNALSIAFSRRCEYAIAFLRRLTSIAKLALGPTAEMRNVPYIPSIVLAQMSRYIFSRPSSVISVMRWRPSKYSAALAVTWSTSAWPPSVKPSAPVATTVFRVAVPARPSRPRFFSSSMPVLNSSLPPASVMSPATGTKPIISRLELIAPATVDQNCAGPSLIPSFFIW